MSSSTSLSSLEPQDRDLNQGLRLIALVYLCIGSTSSSAAGPRPNRPTSTSSAWSRSSSTPSGTPASLDTFDWIIYWGNIAASALQPALFLHFAVSFSATLRTSERRRRCRRRLCHRTALSVPGIFLIGLQLHGHHSSGRRPSSAAIVSIRSPSAISRSTTSSPRIVFWRPLPPRRVAAGAPAAQVAHARHAARRRALHAASTSFPILSTVPVPAHADQARRLSLVFLPLTFSWAIVRYRLMDVDLIFKRGVTYTLATALLVGLYFGIVAVTARWSTPRFRSLGIWGLLAAIIITGLSSIRSSARSRHASIASSTRSASTTARR